jgi:hypothetical protein
MWQGGILTAARDFSAGSMRLIFGLEEEIPGTVCGVISLREMGTRDHRHPLVLLAVDAPTSPAAATA